MTDPGRSPTGSGKDSEALLAEALRARAGGTPSIGRLKNSGSRSTVSDAAKPSSPALTTVQLILAACIAGFVVGILVAVISLV
jgi:hypothetical protein